MSDYDPDTLPAAPWEPADELAEPPEEWDEDDVDYGEPMESAGEWDEPTWAREAQVLADATLTLANLVRRAMDYQVRVPAIAQATGMHYESLIALMEVTLGDGGRILGVDMTPGAPAPLAELRRALPHGWRWATARDVDGTVLVQLAAPTLDGRCLGCEHMGAEPPADSSPWRVCPWCESVGEEAGWMLTRWEAVEDASIRRDDHVRLHQAYCRAARGERLDEGLSPEDF